VTNQAQSTNNENVNSKLAAAQMAPRVLNFGLRVSANPRPKAKIESGNSELAGAPMVPQVSNFGLRVSANNPQNSRLESGDSKPAGAQTACRVSNFGLRVSVLSPHLSGQQLQFLLRVSPPALSSQRIYEIPACITIAQAILESTTAAGWGSSSLFRLANNPFGIKYSHFLLPAEMAVESQKSKVESDRPRASGPETRDSRLGTGDSGNETLIPNPEPRVPIPEPYTAFDAPTWEIENGQKKLIIASFARFTSLDEAFRAHALLLRAPRYRPAFDLRDDWKQFAERLGPKASPLDSEHCGYSTNPSYSAELIKLISIYRLYDPRAVQWFATGRDPGAQFTAHCA
jgi:flagellum-specific peptidoglycan hydrolase FlgJ